MANQTSKSTKKSKTSKTSKRHRSAYILFSIEKRTQIKNTNPNLSPKEMMSELGALWKNADTQTKQHYQKLSDAEKNGYKQNLISTKNQSMEVNSSQ